MGFQGISEDEKQEYRAELEIREEERQRRLELRKKMLGNVLAQKHTPEQIVEILEDIYIGLGVYSSQEVKEGKLYGGHTKSTEQEGYKTLTHGLLAHGLTPQKLHEWAKTHKENEAVSEAIARVREMRDVVLYVRAADEEINPRIAEFLLKSVCGMSAEPKETDDQQQAGGVEMEWQEGGELDF